MFDFDDTKSLSLHLQPRNHAPIFMNLTCKNSKKCTVCLLWLRVYLLSLHSLRLSLMMKGDMFAERKAWGYRPLEEGLLPLDEVVCWGFGSLFAFVWWNTGEVQNERNQSYRFHQRQKIIICPNRVFLLTLVIPSSPWIHHRTTDDESAQPQFHFFPVASGVTGKISPKLTGHFFIEVVHKDEKCRKLTKKNTRRNKTTCELLSALKTIEATEQTLVKSALIKTGEHKELTLSGHHNVLQRFPILFSWWSTFSVAFHWTFESR